MIYKIYTNNNTYKNIKKNESCYFFKHTVYIKSILSALIFYIYSFQSDSI